MERAAGALVRSALDLASDARRAVENKPTTSAPPIKRPSTTIAEPTSSALTDGIRVTVQSLYLPDQSMPENAQYVFAYTVAISNEGPNTAQLRTRHWIITNGKGEIEEVAGDGVVGEQPRLGPGESFQYTSGCVLTTPVGTMHGTYQMARDDGDSFDAAIAPFALASPVMIGDRAVN
jgi:ApaG protein